MIHNSEYALNNNSRRGSVAARLLAQSSTPMVIAALRSPLALFRLPARSWAWLLVYLSVCAAEMGVLALLLISMQDEARAVALHFFFPESWHFAVEYLVDRFLENQQRTVLINAAVTGGLLLITTTLFPLKEALSSSFEQHGGLTKQPMSEFPLWEQGWEEVKLFLLFFAVQGSIFWIGYHPGYARDIIAMGLSYAFLFASYSIDFVSPLFQRHSGHYSQILKTLAKHPMASLLFGAVFSSPVVVVGRLWEANDDWGFSSAIVLLFAANVITVAWAAVAGTWLAARMFDTFRATQRSSRLLRAVAWALVLFIAGFQLIRFTVVGKALVHKSQILKCDYDIDFSSIKIDAPNVLDSITRREIETGIHFDVEMTNPTNLAVEIEQNRIEIRHKGDVIATGHLDPMAIPAGKSRVQRIGLSIGLSVLEIARGRALLDSDAYQIVLVLELEGGWDFPIYLVP